MCKCKPTLTKIETFCKVALLNCTFRKGEFPTPGTGKLRNPDPWGRIIVLKPHPRDNYFQNSSKKPTKHETKIKKNTTEMLICLEN